MGGLMFINRNFNRTEHDDFVLNIKSYLGPSDGATPIWHQDETNNGKPYVIGWVIKPLYE
jgi:hypothetical protein